jgi:hypothetical protein
MNTVIEILRAVEEVQLPDGRLVLARTLEREEALRQALRESLRLERQRQERQRQYQHQGHQKLAGDSPDYGGAGAPAVAG